MKQQTEKLQKVLANQGLGSRREIEKWISDGRVSVDGTVATLGERVGTSAQIRVDGRLINRSQSETVCRVLMYNKPEGEICTRKDEDNRPTVFERLPKIKNGRWIAVGRLDINTSGLLLFTNDGELANRLMHPSHEVEREYAVRVFGEVTPQKLRNLKKGVKLDDGEAKFTKIRQRKQEEDSINQWYDVTLNEGRNREVRRLWESQEVRVSRLIRVRYGDIDLKKRLPQGGWIELSLEEVNELRETVQLPQETTTLVEKKDSKLDHVRLSRMRRSVKKHRIKREHAANRKPREQFDS